MAEDGGGKGETAWEVVSAQGESDALSGEIKGEAAVCAQGRVVSSRGSPEFKVRFQ